MNLATSNEVRAESHHGKDFEMGYLLYFYGEGVTKQRDAEPVHKRRPLLSEIGKLLITRQGRTWDAILKHGETTPKSCQPRWLQAATAGAGKAGGAGTAGH